ncbi:amidohydrolase family protein [Streptomyces sp. NPDC001595]|uniref:amidohydrolase family protein n=1 Tax=Streptomyces sp. NPDC001532 TaxID=3154520 RepID=UPI0033219942
MQPARQVIRAARVFDGERVLPDGAAVFVRDGRIVGVEAAGAPVPEGWRSRDFPGATLLPGLFDMHCHLGSDGHDGGLDRMATDGEARLAEVIEDSLRRQLAAGVTTVRDLGDRNWSVVRRRDLAGAPGAASRPSPTIVAAGPPITTPGGHCAFMGGAVEGPEQLRAAVRERVERGVDVVKVMGSGGAFTPGTDVTRCQFTVEELRIVVDTAHAAGLPVTVHAHALAAVEQALDAGADGVEHCSCLTADGVRITDELLERLARQGTAVCPTLGMTAEGVPPPPVRALVERFGIGLGQRQRTAARMRRAGVRLVSGADSGINAVKPHGILRAAVADLVAGGVPADDALATATSLAADTCGLTDRKGRLRRGLDADLLVVRGDPLRDMAALAEPVAVSVSGVWVGAAGEPRDRP